MIGVKKIELEGKKVLKCGKIEIKDDGLPFTTYLKIDGKPLKDCFAIQSLEYKINVNGKNAGKSKLILTYYPKQK